MGSTSTTAADVMDASASLMNDTAKTVYTYAAQTPYLNMALKELQEEFQLNNIPITNEESEAIEIVAGTVEVTPYDGVGTGNAPHYPNDLVEIQKIWERASGSSDPFIPLTKKEFLPRYTDYTQLSILSVWSWQRQQIRFIGCNQDREIKLDYIRTLFPKVQNEAAVLGVMNCETFLFYRTAGLCTRFIGENPTRADELDSDALLARDRVVGIGTKSKQAIVTRRRPFMQSYKLRGWTR